jgi:hypothetical protein
MSIGTSNSSRPYIRRRIAIVKPGRKIRPQLVIGVLMVLVGVVVLLTGTHAPPALTDEPASLIRVGFAQPIPWYVLGGLVTGLVGLPLVLASLLRNRA